MLHGQATDQVNDAISRGLDFIGLQQLPGGGFYSLSSTHQTDFSVSRRVRTTFFPSLISAALAGCSDQQAVSVRDRISDFLLAQKSPDWSFNYWDKFSSQAKKLPYPDDLDDTFCALIGLYHDRPGLFRGDVTAAVAGLLIATETHAGGPYRSWLVASDAPKAWRDVDIAVNANVAGFLALQEVELPSITNLTEKAIASRKLSSPYYPHHYPVAYFISRWYNGSLQDNLRQLLLADQSSGHWQDPLCTALAISTLVRLDYDVTELHVAADYLLASQQTDGSWPVAAFCIDPMQGTKQAYGGAASLTTALCIEALGFLQAATPSLPLATRTPDKRYAKVTRSVNGVIGRLESVELKRACRAVLRRLLEQDADRQIVLLPWLIADALHLDVDESVLVQLADASLWGWMAYTVYDDFLDGEGQPQYLPAANLCLRNLILTLQKTLPETLAFQIEVQTIMDRLDAANAWEISHCRGEVSNNILLVGQLPDYGDYWQLADRSLGHTIAGLGVLYAAGADEHSLQALRDFFRHYLIARQLNDDAHDWQEDLAAGHINAAGVAVLQHWQEKGGSIRASIDLSAEAAAFRLIMWEQVIPDICKEVFRHSRKARRALARLSLPDARGLGSLLVPHEKAAEAALAGREDTLSFIRSLPV